MSNEEKRYDWSKIRRKCKKLGIFEGYYNPSEEIRWELAKWFVLMSIRNNAKTTNMVLLGMVLNSMYGTRIEYARLSRDDVTPKRHVNFFDTIKSLHYIEKITDNQFNDCYYRGGFWYYQRVNYETLEVEEKATEPFMHCFAVTQSTEMKSNYTSPFGDFLILDEFIDITKFYRDEFLMLCDCMSTIFRERNDCYVLLLANTIDTRSKWFYELDIVKEVNSMMEGEKKLIHKESDLTNVYVEFMLPRLTETKKKNIRDFFNFNNPRLNAITGSCGGWSIKNFPRLPKRSGEHIEYISRDIYMNNHNFLCRLEIIKHEKMGLCVNVVEIRDEVDLTDKIILVNETPHNSLEFFGLDNKIGKLISELYSSAHVFYTSNAAGVTFENFLQEFNVRIRTTE